VSAPYVFSGSPLERVDFRRRDAAWIAERLADPASRLLPVWRLAVPVREGAAPALVWTGCDVRPEQGPEPILLGVQGGRTHFALDVSAVGDPVAELGLAETSFPICAPTRRASRRAKARSCSAGASPVDWHARHRALLGVCGQPSCPGDAGHVRRCSAPECAAEHPRTDPVVIMLVV
jgi:NAD+ diphosphatase